MKRPLNKKPNFRPVVEEPIIERGYFVTEPGKMTTFIVDEKGTIERIIYTNKTIYKL